MIRRGGESDYDLSVFINCPFDEGYRPLFHALIFAVSDCGDIPHCSFEVTIPTGFDRQDI
jgi:hypothetical protein